jgi:hypothetical protein
MEMQLQFSLLNVYKVPTINMSRQFAIKVHLTIRVDPPIAERLAAIADALGCSVGRAATLAVEKGLSALEAHPMPAVRSPAAAPEFSRV